MTEQDKFHTENLLLKSLSQDLHDFGEEALNFLAASYIAGKDERLAAKYHVSITLPFHETPNGKSIFFALNWYSPALKAYACLKSSMTETDSKGAQYLFKAGVDFWFEWKARMESVDAFLNFRRGNPDTNLQLRIILEKLNNPDITGYALERDDIAPKKTAERVIQQLKKFMNGER